jgi:hypothetical protein
MARRGGRARLLAAGAELAAGLSCLRLLSSQSALVAGAIAIVGGIAVYFLWPRRDARKGGADGHPQADGLSSHKRTEKEPKRKSHLGQRTPKSRKPNCQWKLRLPFISPHHLLTVKLLSGRHDKSRSQNAK